MIWTFQNKLLLGPGTIAVWGLLLILTTSTPGLAQMPAQHLQESRDEPTPTTGIEQELGMTAGIEKLNAFRSAEKSSSPEALELRQELLERVLDASFDVRSTLAKIDMEAAYVGEKRYLLDRRLQRRTTALNLTTFAAGGLLGAAGASLSLTRALNHAGTALQAASGGSTIILTAVQLKSSGGKATIDSPYNMLAAVLDRTPNAESRYPLIVDAYFNAPRADGMSTKEAITGAWRRLGRFETNAKKSASQIQSLVADRTSGQGLDATELANRESMLHDLHAIVAGLEADLQLSLRQIEATHAKVDP